MRQIAENAGMDGAVIVDRAKGEKKGIGFDAAKMEWVDMVKAGIIDPAKVTRSALQNAASIAGMLLTTECTVTDMPEKEEKMAGGRPGRRHGRHGRHGRHAPVLTCDCTTRRFSTAIAVLSARYRQSTAPGSHAAPGAFFIFC